MKRTISPLFLALALASQACVATYQWVDENGVTVYSQLPPPSQNEVRKVAPPPPPANPQAVQELQEMRQRLEDLREDRTLEASRKQEESQKQQIRAENCRNAKENIRLLQQKSRQLIKDSDGVYKRYTEEQKAAKIREHQEVMQRNCD